MTAKAIARLHGAYLTFRNDKVPFPLESVIAWYALFAAQEQLQIKGDILEMGVEHGGTAFLEAVALAEHEQLELIDIKTSPRFAEMVATLPEALAARVHFHECSTRAPSLDEIAARQYRFVHIDAGHAKQDVVDDVTRFAGSVAANGILCCDDVFEIRWPGVTEAVLEAVPPTGLVPFLFVNRKLYFCAPDMSVPYRTALEGMIPNLEAFGPVRHWTETMLGVDTLIWKQTPGSATLGGLMPPG